MGPNNNIQLALLQFFQGGCLLCLGPETAENPNIDRKICKSLDEVFIVLLGQDGCWNKNGNLFSIVDGLKSGPHGYLGLSEAHISH